MRISDWSSDVCSSDLWGIKIVHADGTVVPGNFCYIPAAELKLEDSWYVTGLQGTGSDTIVVEDVFVPENRVVHAARSFNYVRSEEHTSELQSLMRISYAVFCLKKKTTQ